MFKKKNKIKFPRGTQVFEFSLAETVGSPKTISLPWTGKECGHKGLTSLKQLQRTGLILNMTVYVETASKIIQEKFYDRIGFPLSSSLLILSFTTAGTTCKLQANRLHPKWGQKKHRTISGISVALPSEPLISEQRQHSTILKTTHISNLSCT